MNFLTQGSKIGFWPDFFFGLIVFSPEIFEFIKKTEPGRNNEIQITDSIRLMLAQGGHGFGVRLGLGEKRYDIGNYKSYFEAFFRFSLADPEFGQDFSRFAKTHL